MAFWIILWKTTLILCLGLFGLLATYVTIFGAIDIKHLLQTLKDEQEKQG